MRNAGTICTVILSTAGVALVPQARPRRPARPDTVKGRLPPNAQDVLRLEGEVPDDRLIDHVGS
jgi:hypothetical protein